MHRYSHNDEHGFDHNVDHTFDRQQGAAGRKLLQGPNSVGLEVQVTAPADQLAAVTQVLNTAISDGSLQKALNTAGMVQLHTVFGFTCSARPVAVCYFSAPNVEAKSPLSAQG